MNLRNQIANNHVLAISIGIIYLWFGVLKYFTNISPAETLAINTIDLLTFHLIPGKISIMLLAIWESALGVLLILNIYRKPVIVMALIHMALTFSPVFLFPNQVFESLPFQLTLLGQYIFKNLVIVAGLITLYRITVVSTKSST